MPSTVEVCNLALSHLGISVEIASLTERSEGARACNRFFDMARDITLRDFLWPFATEFKTLALVEEDPTDEWAYSYREPTESLFIRRIVSGSRTDDEESSIPYKIIGDESGRLIYTDEADAIAEITAKRDTPAIWTSDFVMAVSFLLAGYIAPRVTAGDPYKLGARALQLYSLFRSNAKRTAANEESPDVPPESGIVEAMTT